MWNLLWPSVDTIDDAKKASEVAACWAFLIAVVTAAITYLHTNNIYRIFAKWDSSAYMDSWLFVGIGAGLCFKSRTAAIAGAALYGLEQFYMLFEGHGRFSFIMIFIFLAFINAIRGTFVYCDLRKAEKEQPEDSSYKPLLARYAHLIPSSATTTGGKIAENSPPVKWILAIAAGILALALVLIGYPLAMRHFKKQESRSGGMVNRAAESQETAIRDSAPKSESRTFRLKSGKVIRGKVIFEDDVYFNVKTFDGRQELVIKQDLEKQPQSKK